MSVGRLASNGTSSLNDILYSVHADCDPWGSICRVVLGLATAMQGILGIMIFRSRLRFKKTEDRSFPTPDQPSALNEEVPARTPSFAVDIRPLFRSFDIESMKSQGIDLSSYEDVKKHAQQIYGRLSSKDMPCDGPWNEDQVREFKKWMESRMEP